MRTLLAVVASLAAAGALAVATPQTMARASAPSPAGPKVTSEAGSAGATQGARKVAGGNPASVPNASDPGAFSYFGGPVMVNGVTVHTIYWDPAGNFANQAPGAEDGIDGFIRDVAHDSFSNQTVFSVAREYFDAQGRHILNRWQFGGRIADTDPYPTFGGTCVVTVGVPCVTDAQIQSELQHLVSTRHLRTGTHDAYAVLLPPGVDQCIHLANTFYSTYQGNLYPYNDCAFGGGTDPIGDYCAYHGNVTMTSPQEAVPAKSIIYAALPWLTVAGCGTAGPTEATYDGVVQVLTHELLEVQTDPLGAEPTGTAWYSDQLGEVADACQDEIDGILGSTSFGPYNQVINHHLYLLPAIWSNRAGGCLMRAADRPRPLHEPHAVPASPGMFMAPRYNALPAAVRASIATSFASVGTGPSGASGPALSVGVGPAGIAIGAPGIAESDTDPNLISFANATPNNAIGPTALLEASSTAVAMYNRALKRVAIASKYELGGVPAEVSGGVLQPNVSWDASSGRFEYAMYLRSGDANTADAAQRAADPSLLLYGFSRSANPTSFAESQWCHYAANTDALGANGIDAISMTNPHVGHFDGHIVVAGELFNRTSQRFVAATIATLPSPHAGTLASCPGEPIHFAGSETAPLLAGDGTVPNEIVPVTASGAMPDGYALAADEPFFNGQPTADRIFVWKVGASGAVTPQPDVAVPTYSQPPDAPQPGSPNLIFTNDNSFGQAIAHTWPNGQVSIFVADAASTDSVSPSYIQWFELRPGTTTPLQTGHIGVPGDYLFDAAIAPDSSGRTLTLVYNEAGARLPSVVVATHRAGSAPGTVGAPLVIARSSAPDQDYSCHPADGISCNWGPYSSASTDPLGGAVWVTGQFDATPDALTFGVGWRTVNAEVRA